MSTVHLPHPDEAPEPVRRFMQATQERFRVEFPVAMGAALAAVPEVIPAYQELAKWVYAPGKLSRARKELIATCVAAMNACHY